MKINQNKTRLGLLLVAAAGFGIPSGAEAHPSIVSGPVTGGKSTVVTFGIGHGCSGNDTFAITVDFPAGVTSVRPMTSDFGSTIIEKDDTGAVISVTWQKSVADALDSDSQYYTLHVRMKLPEQPFSEIYFPVHQTCRAADGTLSVVEWTDQPDTPPGELVGEPASHLIIMPERITGWNTFTVPADIPDLTVFFGDAQIVWKDDTAFSPNPNTAELITSTAGISALTTLSAGDEIWVKY